MLELPFLCDEMRGFWVSENRSLIDQGIAPGASNSAMMLLENVAQPMKVIHCAEARSCDMLVWLDDVRARRKMCHCKT